VFCDAASGYIHVEHQVHLSATDTIICKNSFERHAKEHGVIIQEYHTDNGVYRSEAFHKALVENHQAIRHSGVGAKWQNGVAENAIKIVTTRARTMMIHAALHWPEQDDKSLWPLAVTYAAHLYNHTPNLKTGMTPAEVFTGTKSTHDALKHAHPWGCPVYVLEPSLSQAGGKIPKWQPRSRRAQFVGASPLHAENIGVVRNLTTGFITPQYHLIYDEWFETVHAPAGPPPKEWENLCIYHRFHTVFDPEDTPPELGLNGRNQSQSPE
jgi:hypothetical protein